MDAHIALEFHEARGQSLESLLEKGFGRNSLFKLFRNGLVERVEEQGALRSCRVGKDLLPSYSYLMQMSFGRGERYYER